MGIYLKRIYNLTQPQISIVFIVMAISGAIGQMIGGFIADKKNRYVACLLGMIILTGATLMLFKIHMINLLILISVY